MCAGREVVIAVLQPVSVAEDNDLVNIQIGFPTKAESASLLFIGVAWNVKLEFSR